MIHYNEYEISLDLYNRAVEATRVDGNHWIWEGAKSGTRNIPQISFRVTFKGKKVNKVFSVAKLLFIAHNGYCPYQIRKDKSKCSHKMCVNPSHFYAIVEKPEPRQKGKRRDRVIRLQGELDEGLLFPKERG